MEQVKMKRKVTNPEYSKKYYQKHKNERLEYSRKYKNENREKANEYSRRYHKEHKEEDRISKREYRLFKNYGMSEKQYNELLIKQQNVCKICFNPDTRMFKNKDQNKLVVDHNHETGKVRGLLCGKCNSILGYAGDDIKILKKAIEYLQNN